MAGLINTTMGGTTQKNVLDPDKMLEANPVGFDPEKRGVTTDETVAGQVDKIVAADSPIMQRARAQSRETANARGLVNTTMAAQAGEAAVLDRALPIAAADAQTHNLASRENMAAGNTALQVGTDAANRAAITNATEANQVTKLREAGKVESGLLTQKGQIETGLQTLKGQQATQLANIEAQFKQLMQASDSASKGFQTANQTIAAIMADPNTSASQKQAAITKVSQVLQSSLAVSGAIANINLTGLLNFDAGVAY